jgi:hypothetical protein
LINDDDEEAQQLKTLWKSIYLPEWNHSKLFVLAMKKASDFYYHTDVSDGSGI